MPPCSKWKFFLLFALLSYCRVCFPLDDPRVHTHDDAWSARDKCTNKDFPYPQCLCNETRVHCINAQMTQTDLFLHLNHYPNVVSVTFRGNNFVELPAHVLGTTEYQQLRYLNLSANYFVDVDAGAFMGMPNLVSLDLSHNEMRFDESDVDLLMPLPNLRELRLRKAFPRSMPNATQQMDLFRRMLLKAKLNKLRLLDLSYNELERLPERLGCVVPNLEIFLLTGNSFRFFHADLSCYRRLKKLDLSDNYFARLDQRFMKFSDALPTNAVSLQRNPFVCDNRSRDFIQWLRKTPTVQDKTLIMCQVGPDDGCRVRLLDRSLDSGIADATALMCGSAAIGRPESVYRFSLLILGLAAAAHLGVYMASARVIPVSPILGIGAAVAGFFAFGGSFLGFAGAYLENRRLLITYICLASFTVLNEFGGSISFMIIGSPAFRALTEKAMSGDPWGTPGTGSPKNTSDHLSGIYGAISGVLFVGVVLKGITIGFAGYMWNEIRKRGAPPPDVIFLKVN